MATTTRKPARKTSAKTAAARKRRTSRQRTRSVPDKPVVIIEELSDFNESINILIYGDSGVGKTPLVGLAPNAVFLSTEKGAISAKRFGSTAKRIKAYSWEEIEAALDYLEEHTDEFDWLLVDSLTKMQVLHIRWILRVQNAENEERDLDIPAIQDHQKWQNMFKRFVDRIIDMNINTVFVCTAMHKEDEEGEDIVLPDLQGKDYAISQYVCAQMDGVYCLKVKEDKSTGEPIWHLLVRAKPPYFAKDRHRAFKDPVLRAPDMPQIIDAIETSAVRTAQLTGDDSADEDDEDVEERVPQRARRSSQRKGRDRVRQAGKSRRRPTTDTDDDQNEFDPDDADDDVDFAD